MKTSKLVLAVLIFVFVCSVEASSQRNYWQEIKKLNEQADSNAYRDYFAKLSADELIIAARQCSEELQEVTQPEDWEMVGSMALSFFYEYYPQKTNGLEDISPLIAEFKNKSQSPFWRRALMHMLSGSWQEKLSIKQSLTVAKVTCDIFSDHSEQTILRSKAIGSSTLLLRYAYQKNIMNDTEARKVIDNNDYDFQKLKDAVQSGQIKMTAESKKINGNILLEVRKSINSELELFSDSQVDIKLQQAIIVSFDRYHQYGLDTSEVKTALVNALDNYKRYDEKLWNLLIKTNVESFGNRNASGKLQDMIDEAKDKTNKEHLTYFQRELEKEAKKEKQSLPDTNVETK
ncbi:MAG: hypothetical protein PHY02_07635 [Phycisphaerae bacterium]|nr:hypothetical protein [Phycisphaerae bacterium]